MLLTSNIRMSEWRNIIRTHMNWSKVGHQLSFSIWLINWRNKKRNLSSTSKWFFSQHRKLVGYILWYIIFFNTTYQLIENWNAKHIHLLCSLLMISCNHHTSDQKHILSKVYYYRLGHKSGNTVFFSISFL
jgi:hypothetical protein